MESLSFYNLYPYTIYNVFLSFQAAHSDIESHGQLIKSVVELCDKHIRRNYKQRTQSSNVANRQRQSIRHQPRVILYYHNILTSSMIFII